MTAKERLLSLVDDLSEEEAAAALPIVERRRVDPMLQALATAALDDEASSTREDATARESFAAYRQGDGISADELKRDLGIG